MQTTSWDKYFPLLAPYVSAAPDASMRLALYTAATSFLADTYLWIEELDSQPLIAGEHTYDLFASGAIEAVLWAALSDRVLHHTHIREIPKLHLSAQGRPTYFWLTGEKSVRLWPTPDADEPDFVVGAVLKPTSEAPGAPSWLFDDWAEAVVDGAIYQLARIPGKDWSDPKLAALHKAQFDRAKANARRRDYRDVPRRAKPRAFV